MTSSSSDSRKAANTITRYRLDERDRIIDVGGEWDRFALENGADDLSGNLIIGLPLRSFISGDITRMFIETMHSRVRLTGRPAVVPYRCDSPGVKRFMQMSIEAIGKELVSEHCVLSERPTSPFPSFVTTSGGASRRWIKRCSMCNRCQQPDGSLAEPEALGIADGEAVSAIYFVCADCRARVRARLSDKE